MVELRKGGPYSLFCTECHMWVLNTANYEMKKEGFFAHSHVCGIQNPDEISEEKWNKIHKKIMEES